MFTLLNNFVLKKNEYNKLFEKLFWKKKWYQFQDDCFSTLQVIEKEIGTIEKALAQMSEAP